MSLCALLMILFSMPAVSEATNDTQSGHVPLYHHRRLRHRRRGDSISDELCIVQNENRPTNEIVRTSYWNVQNRALHFNISHHMYNCDGPNIGKVVKPTVIVGACSSVCSTGTVLWIDSDVLLKEAFSPTELLAFFARYPEVNLLAVSYMKVTCISPRRSAPIALRCKCGLMRSCLLASVMFTAPDVDTSPSSYELLDTSSWTNQGS